MSPEDRQFLLSVYSTERQDDQNALVIAFAIATAGITYVTLGAAYISDRCKQNACSLHHSIPDIVLLVAPAIPVALVGFLILNLAASRVRSVHLQRLEYALQTPLSPRRSAVTEPSLHTDQGLVYRPMDRLWDRPLVARWLFILTTILAYGPILVALLGFTWFSLHYVSDVHAVSGAWIAYGIAEGIEVATLLRTMGGSRFTYAGPAAGVFATHNRENVIKALTQHKCLVIRTVGNNEEWSCPCGLHLAEIPKQKKLTGGVVNSIVAAMSCLPEGWLA